MNDKLKKIDILLNNEIEFKKYINEIDHVEISYSNKLEEKILLKVKKQKSVYYFNIFKMVACVTVALILCQTEYIKNPNFSEKHQISQKIVQKNTYLNDKINEIGDFFMKSINLEEGEK
ncbi:MAG: hypothetical protein PHD15_03875 [Clostridia bacterium]|nr:hypothetical protein [Clostridia bacterium]MDD4386880.1 hypothetical protein [Clostridia bacterium]